MYPLTIHRNNEYVLKTIPVNIQILESNIRFHFLFFPEIQIFGSYSRLNRERKNNGHKVKCTLFDDSGLAHSVDDGDLSLFRASVVLVAVVVIAETHRQ